MSASASFSLLNEEEYFQSRNLAFNLHELVMAEKIIYFSLRVNDTRSLFGNMVKGK